VTSSAIIIPARYKSTRLPGKPLIKLGDKTMIETVYEKCKATGRDTYVLTDSMAIAGLFDWQTCWIDQTVRYENGTERCAGAIDGDLLSKYDNFINVQGDMPDVTEEMIDKAEWHLKHYSVTTVFTEMPEEKQNEPSSVKMVRAGDQALWFGRGMTGYGEWHLGVYGYKRNALNMYMSLPQEREEQVEKLEQLRWLKSGWQIGCLSVQYKGTEINTPKDVEEWHSKNYQ